MARIMIAEDSPVNQSVYTFILQSAQHEVLLADDGRDAWDQLQNVHVDLLISDISMPQMDGLTLLENVRKSAARQRLPVIMLTGIGVDEERLQHLAAGADAVLTKPTSSWELLRTVNSLLEVSS